jgi:hypothetical protein
VRAITTPCLECGIDWEFSYDDKGEYFGHPRQARNPEVRGGLFSVLTFDRGAR